MLVLSSTAAPAAATLPLFLPQAPPDKVSGLIHAATLLAQLLGQGRAVDSRALRSAMETVFCGSDAEGAWVWKDAYEALEAAQVLFPRKFGAAMRTRAGSAAAPGSSPGQAMLEMLTRLAARLPSQTRRSEEAEQLQQFSTPIPLGFAAAEAAKLTPADLVLEPSAGTGLLAIFAEHAKARLCLNEIADTRAGLLGRLFRGLEVSRHNAEQIHDRLDPAIQPSVGLMNPPFSASPHVERRFAETAMRHIASALARLADGGRLVAITGRNTGPDQPDWREGLHAPAGESARRLHRRDRRSGLCPPRHHDRDPAHGHRPDSRRGPARIPAVTRHGCRYRRTARLGCASGPGAVGDCSASPATRPRHASIPRGPGRAAESACASAYACQTPGPRRRRARLRNL